jgi:hypothetical protein
MTTELAPPDIPELSDDWVALRRNHLVNELNRSIRKRITRRIVLIGTLAAAASIVALVLVEAGPGTTNVFAGWTAAPSQPTPGQFSSAESACKGGTEHWPQPMPALVLSDARGPFTTLLYADTQTGTIALCTAGADLLELSGCNSTFPPGTPEAAPPDALVFRMEVVDPGYTEIAGQVGTAATAASVRLADGTIVQVTIGGGWFEAWWPGRTGVRSVQVSTESGVTNEALSLLNPNLGVDGASCTTG